jgi:serine/threonine protein kinase
MGKMIGSGTYSTVEEAAAINGIGCVLKSVPVSYCSSEDARGTLKHAFREILALRCLAGCKNIIKLVEARSTSSAIHLYLEKLDVNLAVLVKSADEPLPVSIIKHVTKCVALALEHCRLARIIHRDVKPSNILLSLSDGVVKLCDFGLARRIAEEAEEPQIFTAEIGTMWYKPIEILMNSIVHTNSIDVWSLGCVSAEMHRLRPLFGGSVSIEQLYLIQDCLGPLNTSTWSDFATMSQDENKIEFDVRGYGLGLLLPGIDPFLLSIISACLEYDPKQRIEARTILGLLEPPDIAPDDFANTCKTIFTDSSLQLYTCKTKKYIPLTVVTVFVILVVFPQNFGKFTSTRIWLDPNSSTFNCTNVVASGQVCVCTILIFSAPAVSNGPEFFTILLSVAKKDYTVVNVLPSVHPNGECVCELHINAILFR